MKYILLIIQNPSGNNSNSSEHQAYGKVLDEIKTSQLSSKHLQQIGAGVIWSSVEDGLHEIAPLISCAKKEQVPHRILFYDNEDCEMIHYLPNG